MTTAAKVVREANRQIESARKRFDHDIAELAAHVRTEHIVPLCREFDCEFFSGNGTFFFSFGKRDRHGLADLCIGNAADEVHLAPKKMQKRLRMIMEILDIETEHNGCVGYAVADVLRETAEEEAARWLTRRKP